MNRNIYRILGSLMIITILLSACGASTSDANQPPAENSSNPPASDSPSESDALEIIPMVVVSDQDASSGNVTIQKVIAAARGWIVIHTEADGAPGPIVGYAQVAEGENNAVAVEIDLDGATEKLFAMLHLDAGTAGTYEFPGDDVPVKVDDTVVMTPFLVTLPQQSMTPSVTVSDQETDGVVTITEVVSASPGWIVIHTEADGGPGPIVGYAQVDTGNNTKVDVEIDLEAATDKLFAMLHLDAGTAGTYEFPGDDVPVKVDDVVVMTPFMIMIKETNMDNSQEGITVLVKDSRFDEKELTVKAGTTVTWIMDASFPHTVTADDGQFDSGRMSDGESFSFTFDQPGEFPYYCTLHGGLAGAGMSGTITVTN